MMCHFGIFYLNVLNEMLRTLYTWKHWNMFLNELLLKNVTKLYPDAKYSHYLNQNISKDIKYIQKKEAFFLYVSACRDFSLSSSGTLLLGDYRNP